MDYEENLGILSKRALDLVDKISGEIKSESISFCRHCSEHGVNCGIAETPLMLVEERERLVGIRDSLKDVEAMLVFLQRLQPYQQQQHHTAILKLEESRLQLIQKLQHFQQIGRKLDVIEELTACFGDVGRDKGNELNVNNRKSWFLVRCIKGLFCPWNWHHTAKIAIKIVVLSFSVSSTCNLLHQSRQDHEKFRRNSSLSSLMIGKGKNCLSDLDNSLDVAYGMG